MILDEIPSTWTTCTLDEIAQITQGNGFPKNLQGKTQGKYPFYKVGDISRTVKDGRIKLEESDHYIDDLEVRIIKGNILPPKTIVFAKIGEALKLNRRAMTSIPALIDNNVAGVKANPLIDDDFLFHFFQTVDLENYSRATAVPSVRKSDIEKIPFRLPPLNEQRRIVVKIEELFTELEAGVASLRQAQAQLKTYRQALLKHAFAGKLTAVWREEHQAHLEDAPTLLQRIKTERQARYEAELAAWEGNGRVGKKPRPPQELPPLTTAELNELPQLPAGWAWVKSGQIVDPINNGYTPSAEYMSQDQGEVPFVKVYNLNFDGSFNFGKNPTFIPKRIHQKDLQRSICKPGDVLINIVGPPLGKVSVLTNQYPEWNINQAIVLFRPNEFICSGFISFFLQEPNTIRWLESTSKATAGQFNVKVSTCREIPIPLLSLKEQNQIVVELEFRLSVVDQLEQTITTTLQQAEALRQSILKKAFAGQLVPQDPHDEPASVLLGRIRAAKS